MHCNFERPATSRFRIGFLASAASMTMILLAGCGGSGVIEKVAQAQETKPQDPKTEKSKTAESKAGKAVKVPAVEKPENKHPFTQRFDAPEFPKGADWLNGGPLTKHDLKGKFVLLDFWTFCCINCMHILPELKKLEDAYPNELVVIGVHSAKFEGEKDTDNIRDAILRHEIVHPVINDAEHVVWDSYGVQSWPTIIMIDPEGKAVWGSAGEFKAEAIHAVLDKAIPYYRTKQLLNEKPLNLKVETHKAADTPLRYPGKILADEKSNRLFVSDSNHNRIVIADLNGKVSDVIGHGMIGASDGSYETASFNHPQGMVLHGETLYVADTENHMLRKIDLKAKKVATIAGNGTQAPSGFPGFEKFTLTDDVPKGRWLGKPSSTELNSPWDLWIHNDVMYIAMAGPHQIWYMPLDESSIGPYAGNGREDIVDGPVLPTSPYALGASSFAQPSGLTADDAFLYVADSEGSSIRAVPFDAKRKVSTVVGTAELPFGRLFHFGDVDGKRETVKLQHCLGVAFHQGTIFVADTYNNKIKAVDAKTGDTVTFVGTGKPGADDAAPTFDEPSGLSIAGGKIYLADTNNHLIRTIDLKTRAVSTLTLAGLQPPVKKATTAVSTTKETKLDAVTVKANKGKVRLTLSLDLPPGWKSNPLGKPRCEITSPNESGVIKRTAFGKLKLEAGETKWEVELPVSGDGDDILRVAFTYYYCEKINFGRCKAGDAVFLVPIKVDAAGNDDEIRIKQSVVE